MHTKFVRILFKSQGVVWKLTQKKEHLIKPFVDCSVASSGGVRQGLEGKPPKCRLGAPTVKHTGQEPLSEL